MPRRLKPTLTDYLVIAVNPALTMVLIGSLIYFLLELFYQGNYPARLHFCLSAFVFGAVLIARISMEQGWERAAPLGAALAVVVALSLDRYVSYTGTELADVGWLINYGLMGIAWWCAHKLTWDCTLMDEQQDASGQGLLQSAGIDGQDGAIAAGSQAENDPLANQADTASQNGGEQFPSQRLPKEIADLITPGPPKSPQPKSWWQRFLERRRRFHAPGVWVVYFSLAALPLFGIGQAFIPAANTSSRRYAFVLLCIYVASGLGLLLTTSFLGLRRYLRQRRLEMPLTVAGTWLTTGCILIVSLIALTALLPRPNAEYVISQLPFEMATSADHKSSPVSAGGEGTKDRQANSAPGKSGSREKENLDSDKSRAEQGPADGREGKSKSGGGSQPPTSKHASSQEGKAQEDTPNKTSADGAQSDQQSDDRQSPPSSQPEAEPQSSPSADSPQATSEAPPSTPEVTPPDVATAITSILPLVKWIFYGALLLLAGWWCWSHRSALLAWLLALLTGWHDFWKRFWADRREKATAKQLAAQRKSFAEFTDPFAAGVADRYPPAELVRYSFGAFEAWARDNGWPREAGQTAYEFARQIGVRAEHLSTPARTLAELYSRAAYSPAALPEASLDHLRSFWQALYHVPISYQ